MPTSIKISLLFLIMWPQITGAGEINDNPEPPVIRSVSVINIDGHVVIEWQESITPGITYYELNEYDPQGSELIDERISPDSRSYLHTTQEPNFRPFSYDMRAIRIIENDTTYSILSAYHTTIHKTAQWDSCGKSVDLGWTPYRGWQDSIDHYRILSMQDGDDFGVAVTVTADTLFRHTGLDINREYCYQIEAVHKNGLTATSNITCLFTAMSREPEWINADYATVESNRIEVRFTADPDSELTIYSLLKSGSPEGGFTAIHRYDDHPGNIIRFFDNDTETGEVNYYMLEAINYCEEVTAVSNLASNIFLEADKEGFIVLLEWNEHREWLGGTERQVIYRIAGSGSAEQLSVTEAGQTSMTDDLEAIHRGTLLNRFCYYVEALEAAGNPHGIAGQSRSNIVCINLSSQVFLPTAFTPGSDGQNSEFHPIILFEPTDYLFVIMDRFGSRVFESRNPEAKWNGRLSSGRLAPEGVYLYYLRLQAPEGEIIEKRGHVVLFL